MNLFLLACVLFAVTAAGEEPYRILVGSYTKNVADTGIHAYSVDCRTGEATLLSATGGVMNPSYLAFSPDGRHVYAVSEHGASSTVSAFAFDGGTARLQRLNSVSSPGADPCYLSVTERHVVTANYSGGSISVFGREEDGSLTEALQVVHHTGGSVDPARQREPHVHQTVFTPDGAYLLVNDLGTDRVTSYRYRPDAAEGILAAVDSVTVKRGSGPRHLAFRPGAARTEGEHVACVLHELDGTVSTLAVDAGGRLRLLHEASTVRRSDVRTGAADIHFSPDGRFLYASNRGTANDITCFAVDRDGALTFVQQVSSGGNGPRNFALTPDGKYLFAANQQTGSIAVFTRDAESGQLADSGIRVAADRAVCVLFF
jgi:6-phosphogluconolactonase